MPCIQVGKLCTRSGDNRPVQIDLTEFCERLWNSKRGAGIYPVNSFVRPTPNNKTGFEYEAMIGGQVGPTEPPWPVVVGETVQDGSVVWTCRAISNNSLTKTIEEDSTYPDWDGNGFTVDDEQVVNSGGRQVVQSFISGELAKGKYMVTVTVKFSDGHIQTFGVEAKVE